MNRIHKSIHSNVTGTCVAVAESAGRASHTSHTQSCSTSPAGAHAGFAVAALSACLMLGFASAAQAQPTGGVVAAGGATISSAAGNTTINQSTANAVINWQSFGTAAGQSVTFVQPSSSSVALNRVLGSDPSQLLGSLSANGKVFLVNPNGVLFGSGASVNVGGLVASTLNVSDTDFMAGRYAFTGAGSGSVVNQGTITASDGGYVALMGQRVSNQGVISARLGSVALAAGQSITMDLAGDGLLNVSIPQGAVNALVDNGGLIKADGGRVLMTTQAAGDLLQTVVNNTGVVQAQTLENRNGTILLLGDMQTGTLNAAGTLDASAPTSGNGGFIETSAARVNINDSIQVTTAAANGTTGLWLIDPQDFIVGAGGNILGSTLSALLVTNSVRITTSTGSDAVTAGTPPLTTLRTSTNGNGDIFVNDAISWTSSGSPTTLTLNADRDVNINNAITAVDGNVEVCCGRDINVNNAITVTRGDLLLNAGRNLNQNAAITVTNGNVMMCAAQDVNINAKLTYTDADLLRTNLRLPAGLTIVADGDGTGPGTAGGTLVFAALAPPATVTNAPVTIFYNPSSYATPTDYTPKFILSEGAAITQKMLVFPEANKTFDGSTTATFNGLKANPTDVSLVADPGATATFVTAEAGTGKTVTFTGYRLEGLQADRYAFATPCCGTGTQRTTANITAPADILPVRTSNFSTLQLALLPAALTYTSVLPTAYNETGDYYLATIEPAPEIVPVPAPPVRVEVPYEAPVYAPKQERN